MDKVSSLMADYLKRLTGKSTLDEAIFHFELTTLDSFTDPAILIVEMEKYIGLPPGFSPSKTYPLSSRINTEE